MTPPASSLPPRPPLTHYWPHGLLVTGLLLNVVSLGTGSLIFMGVGGNAIIAAVFFLGQRNRLGDDGPYSPPRSGDTDEP